MNPSSNPSSPKPENSGASRQGEVSVIRKRRIASSTRVLSIIAWVFVGTVVLAVAGKTLYPYAKRLRARSLAKQTLALIDAGRYSEALPKLPVILRLAKDDVYVLRAVARYFTSQGIPNSLDYWERLRATDMATVDDLLGFVSVALDASRTDLSAPVISSLVAQYPDRIDVLQLGMRHLETAGFSDRAIELGRHAMAVDHFNPKTARMLGQLLLSKKDKAASDEGKALLWSVAEIPGPERDAALIALASMDNLTSTEIADLIRALEPSSGHDATKRVRIIDLRWRSGAATHPQVLEEVSQWLRTESNPTNFASVAMWAVKSAPEALPLAIDETRAATNQLMLLHLSDALAELGRWPQLHVLLEKYEKHYPAFAMDMLQSREAAAAHQNNNAEKYLLSAGLDAEGDARKLAMAAGFAEAEGFINTAIQLWEQMLNVRDRSVGAAAQILRLCKDRDDLAVEQRALHRLASQIPGDTRLNAESAERDVLVNIGVAPALQALEKQIAAEPGELRWKFAAALGELRLGNPSAALSRLEQIEIRDAQMTARFKAIYAAILGANQQREAARRYARQLGTEKLKSQERELIQPYL